MEVVAFYSKGVHLRRRVVLSRRGINPKTFSPMGKHSVRVEDLGYVPSGGDRRIRRAHHEVIVIDGIKYLALNEGHLYSVVVEYDDKVLDLGVVSAEHEHALIQIPDSAEVLVEASKDEAE